MTDHNHPHYLSRPGEGDIEEIADASDIFEPPPPGTPPPADHLLNPVDNVGLPVLPDFTIGSTASLFNKMTLAATHPLHRGHNRYMVAVDDSVLSEDAFDWVCRCLAKDEDDLVVIHVLKTDEYAKIQKEDAEDGSPRPLDKLQRIGNNLRKAYRKRLSQFPVANVNFSVQVKVADSPKAAICELASELQVDTLVLGTSGTSSIKEFLLGTTSTYCLKHATVPVVIVKPNVASSLQTAGSTAENATPPSSRNRWSFLSRRSTKDFTQSTENVGSPPHSTDHSRSEGSALPVAE
ncbi:hypothetical protein DFS34DRAFT_609408 [Phlyctochytrium arcticum]|nr:hypothetical protein DFS34DRAFT_609408 [Phlyctochytrium arcticum]